MVEIALADIVRKTGAKSDSKVRQMRRSLRNGGKLPAIRVAFIDDTLRKRLSRMGLPTNRKYFLLEGHHRYCAFELEKRKTIAAKIIHKLY
jgi:uncharacterized ParB-like nuclease family protein